MQVSCKVSYSVLLYVERQGVQLDPFFENFETPIEFLKDSSCWLPVTKMEEFLSGLLEFMHLQNGSSLYREIGQQNYELRAWGVLDSVLKMVESPRDIFSQPDRFLSYFLTPYPEITIEKQDEGKVLFHLVKEPSAHNVLSYLMGAVEGLPRYMGAAPARVEVVDSTTFQIHWVDNQQSLFDENEKMRRQFHPEIVHSVIKNFKGQRDSEHEIETSAAFEKMVAVEVEKRLAQWAEKQKDFDASFFKIKNDFYKMYDYFTRAQQIITLVSPSARKASVREAMRRVDWDYVQKEFPKMVESACDSILSLKDAFHVSTSTTENTHDSGESVTEANLPH